MAAMSRPGTAYNVGQLAVFVHGEPLRPGDGLHVDDLETIPATAGLYLVPDEPIVADPPAEKPAKAAHKRAGTRPHPHEEHPAT